MHDILNELIQLLDAGQACIVCTLAETRGSTPQKAGATMLVLPDGQQRGTLGGGCVEAEVKQRALRSLASRQHELLTFHLDDNYGWDDGLICGGRMNVVAQPVLPGSTADESVRYFRRFQELVADGQGCTEVLVLRSQPEADPGARLLISHEAHTVIALHAQVQLPAVSTLLIDVAHRPQPYVRQGLAFLPVLPRIRLLIVGGGHVGQAVARLATEADFDVWVLDDRELYACRERFPHAQRLIVGEIGTKLKELRDHDVTASTYCIIVTRGHAHDEEALYHLATSPAAYVGMIGSKRKIRLIFDDLVAKGRPRECLSRIHAPLGLNIGSQTVPEIAISIVAELIAHRNLGAVPAGARELLPLSVAQP